MTKSIHDLASYKGYTLSEGEFVLTQDQEDELIDQHFPEVTIAGFTYPTSLALRNTDPIALRGLVLDLLDGVYQDLEFDLLQEDYSDMEFLDDEN